MNRRGGEQGHWRRAVLAALIGVAVVIRLLQPIASERAMALDALFANPHILCLSDASDRPIDQPAPPAHNHRECGDCCLNLAQAALAEPQATHAVFFAAAPLPLPAPGYRLLARGPPAEAWADDHAQRGPPNFPIA